MEPFKPAFSFSDTAIAFQDKSNDDLKKARLLFSAFNYKWLLKAGPSLAKLGLNAGLPIKGLLKDTIFAQFCGGESIEDCAETVERLYKVGIGTILDYSVEGQEDESTFDATMEEILRTIRRSAEDTEKIPFAVFKVSGIGRFSLLEKASKSMDQVLGNDLAEFQRMENRFRTLCSTAAHLKVRLLVDAEETWIQAVIDRMTEEAAALHNQNACYIYNTIQMYRRDRLAYLERCLADARERGFQLGIKLVRGAYMEKERMRAYKMGYPSPIQRSKAETDRDFDEALRMCMDNIAHIYLCSGTHNENSSNYLAKLMHEKGIQPSDKKIYFAQLLGMSDHISYNLAHAGYNVAKYVPYGPLKEVLPYLSRRAEENSSVKGQAGRELQLIHTELKRRNHS